MGWRISDVGKYLNLMMIMVCGTASAINLNAQSTIKVILWKRCIHVALGSKRVQTTQLIHNSMHISS